MTDIRIGVDTGGTFTDFVIFRDGRISTKKIPSTPANPSFAILEGLREYLDGGAEVSIIHGTTVATNALLERKGARTALITTAGFEDVHLDAREDAQLPFYRHVRGVSEFDHPTGGGNILLDGQVRAVDHDR